MEEKDLIEIDIAELFRYLKKKAWVVIAAGVVCALLAFLLSAFVMQPKYTASTRVYVLNRANEENIVYSDIQISTYLSYDFQTLITGHNVTREVIDELGLNMSDSQLASCIEVTSEENTRVLQINVTYHDPQLAADIANCVRRVAAEQIQDIMELDAVKTVYEAEPPAGPSSPNARRNTLIGAGLGVLICVSVYVLLFALDDTIRTEDDVQRYLGVSVLGVIPESEALRTIGNQPVRKGMGARKAQRKMR
jgi:capsular polysaccharide biosynthesis protein